MAPSTRLNKRGSSSSGGPDLADPQQKKLKSRISKGGATPSLIVKIPHSAEKHFTEPDAGTTPSLIVTFPCSAEEHPTRSLPMNSPPAKAPRGRTPKIEQMADQQGNSFSIDTRPKSWGMPKVWAEVLHSVGL